MKPILFNTEMVRAILDGRKTVTRRIVKAPYFVDTHETPMPMRPAPKGSYVYRQVGSMPYPELIYNPGDILYVRETFVKADDGYHYRADATPDSEQLRKAYGYKFRPSIHMPREAARIFLRVTDVRAERLQDITPDSCAMEGIELYSGPVGSREAYYKREFAKLWNSTIPQKDSQSLSWGNNPWVWVIEFERCEKP